MKIYFKNNWELIFAFSKPKECIEVDYNYSRYGSHTDDFMPDSGKTTNLILINGKLCVVFANEVLDNTTKEILSQALQENECQAVQSTEIHLTENYLPDYAEDITQLPEYTDGRTAGIYNRDGRVFEIIANAEVYVNLEFNYDIANEIQQKREQLKKDFENNKVYVIENGVTMTIDNNSKAPNGENSKQIFDKLLEEALNVKPATNDLSVKIYQQKQGVSIYRLSAINTILRQINEDLFHIVQNDVKFSIRQVNKCRYDEIDNKLSKAKTLAELESITWSFIPFPKIKVDEMAVALLANPEISEIVKDKIREREFPVGSGHFKLIEKL